MRLPLTMRIKWKLANFHQYLIDGGGDLSDLPLNDLMNRLDLRIISSDVPYNEQILLVDVV